jgi:hypothetical protein
LLLAGPSRKSRVEETSRERHADKENWMYEREDGEDALSLADLEPTTDPAGGHRESLAEIEIDVMRLLDQLTESNER